MTENKKIIIVDNASQNESGKELEKKYRDSQVVKVVINTKNLGFAKGNNIGFVKAKMEFNPGYIILINNDTIINQSNFCDKINQVYCENHFAVLGPKIISLVDGINQNPVPYTLSTRTRVLRRLIMFCILYISSYFHIDQKLSREKRKSVDSSVIPNNYQLHGSCLIFSSEYICQFNGLYADTFMYLEEDILKYICVKNNLKMIYCDEMEIFHKEGSSTKTANGIGIVKRRFYYKNTINSLLQLLLLMLNVKRM